MSKQKLCDMCNRKIDTIEDIFDTGFYPLKIKIKEDHFLGGWIKLDVCSRCAKKIREICIKEKYNG